MNKITWIIILIILIGGYFLLTPSEPMDDSPIKIGVILPLTGDLASIGENAKNGAMLAEKNFTDNMERKIELIFEDDHFDPKQTVLAFNKLVDVDNVSAIVCFASGPCSSVAPIADEKQVPLIAVSSAEVQKEKTFVVRLEISTAEEAKRLLSFIEERNYERVSSIVAKQDGIETGYKKMSSDKDFLSKEVSSEKVQPDLNDFRTPIAKLLAENPDVIFVGLLPGYAGEFGKQARTLGYKGDFIGFNFIEGEETLMAAEGNLEEIVYTQVSGSTSWFVEKYKEMHGESVGLGSAHAHDAVMLISEAVKSNKVNPSEMIEFLTEVKDFNGALGVYGSVENGEFSIPLSLKTIKNGEFVKYEAEN